VCKFIYMLCVVFLLCMVDVLKVYAKGTHNLHNVFSKYSALKFVLCP